MGEKNVSSDLFSYSENARLFFRVGRRKDSQSMVVAWPGFALIQWTVITQLSRCIGIVTLWL